MIIGKSEWSYVEKTLQFNIDCKSGGRSYSVYLFKIVNGEKTEKIGLKLRPRIFLSISQSNENYKKPILLGALSSETTTYFSGSW